MEFSKHMSEMEKNHAISYNIIANQDYAPIVELGTQ